LLSAALKYYRIDRRQIAFLKFIIEAYEGIAMLRTVDAKAGIVALHIPPGCEPDTEQLLESLKDQMMIESISFEEQKVKLDV
jgi:hypothetical protein